MTAIPTSTISVCLSDDEAEAVRLVASHAALSKSAWAASRIAASMASKETRADVLATAKAIEADGSPRGFRNTRVSTVLRVHDHDSVKEAARSLKLAVHAYIQAAIVGAAKDERATFDITTTKPKAGKAVQRAGTFLSVVVPLDYRNADVVALSATVRDLVKGTATAILDGKGRMMSGGVQRLAAKVNEGAVATLQLDVPEFDVAASAFILAISPGEYATALATRALQNMQRGD